MHVEYEFTVIQIASVTKEKEINEAVGESVLCALNKLKEAFYSPS